MTKPILLRKYFNPKISKSFLLFYFFVVVVLLITYLQTFVPVEDLTKDTIAVSGGKFYHGFFSNVGLFLWCATSAICFFSYTSLKKSNYPVRRKLILFGGFLSLILMLDDFLLLHELVFPRYVGLNEKYFFTSYFALLLIFNIYFFKEIVGAQVLLLYSSFAFFALSIICDQILPQFGNIVILEDGFKLLGIVGWCCFFWHVCLKTLKVSFKVKSKIKRKKQLYFYKDLKSEISK